MLVLGCRVRLRITVSVTVRVSLGFTDRIRVCRVSFTVRLSVRVPGTNKISVGQTQ